MKTSKSINNHNQYNNQSLRQFAKAIMPEGTAFSVAEHPMPSGNIQYFRDNFGTEFIFPARGAQHTPFSIRLKVGHFPQTKIRQIAFLFAAEGENQNQQYSSIRINKIDLPEAFQLELDEDKTLMDYCWTVKAEQTTQKVDAPIRIKLQANAPGKVIGIVVYETCMAGLNSKSPHIFVVDIP